MLSHYRVLSRLGAGGMGEVYLAKDTNLGREVALKVLSAEFTQREDRMRRFAQEARAEFWTRFDSIADIITCQDDEEEEEDEEDEDPEEEGEEEEDGEDGEVDKYYLIQRENGEAVFPPPAM